MVTSSTSPWPRSASHRSTSVPELLVTDVLRWLAERGYGDVEEVTTADERTRFALPRELR